MSIGFLAVYFVLNDFWGFLFAFLIPFKNLLSNDQIYILGNVDVMTVLYSWKICHVHLEQVFLGLNRALYLLLFCPYLRPLH